jgi:hypothetical protein
MTHRLRMAWMVAVSVIACAIVRAETPKSGDDAKRQQTEITSELMQIEKGGETTLFKGNVLLKQLSHWIEADRMTRTKLTGVANARGHVKGTWTSDKGEKIIGLGDAARYSPLTQTTELWGDHRAASLTRWETVKDTAPVVIHALHFTAYQKENRLFADRNVVITQIPRFEGHSSQAVYDRTSEKLDMYGPSRVQVHIEDGKGRGDFIGDRASMTMNPRHVRMMGNVTGHVIPSEAS